MPRVLLAPSCLMGAALLLTTATPAVASDAPEARAGTVAQVFPKDAEAAAADMSADGRVAVAVNTDDGITVVRFTSGGAVDTSYGTKGYARVPATGVSAAAVAFDEDGSLTVAGTRAASGDAKQTAVLARLTKEGKPDKGFSGDGVLFATALPAGTEAAAVAVQGDGKAVLAARAEGRLLVGRWGNDGRRDASFDGDGLYRSPAKDPETPTAIALQEDGTVVVAGSTEVPGQQRHASLWSLTPKGAPTSGFGTKGKLLIASAVQSGVSDNMVVDSSGNIVMTGSAGGKFAVVRHRHTGAADTTYGEKGLATIPTATDSEGNVVGARTDGHVLTAGRFGTVLGVAATTNKGEPDGEFGTRGLTRLDFGTAPQRLCALLVQGDGYVVVVGTAGARHLVLARFDTAGALDPRFGG
ncbi:hypothetical protein [Streptomyces sp. NPDC094032]|uniref:hypothetical protein n=1 Tax=Streptomyces sp. NPDC094032 TaxID=3155308 RepID=UPI00331FB97B